MDMALHAVHKQQQQEAHTKVQQWLTDQMAESSFQATRPIRKRKQTELGQEYCLGLQTKGRQSRTEIPAAMREAPQAMNGELIRPDKEDDTEMDQRVMVLEQQTETDQTAESSCQAIRPVRKRKQTELGREYFLGLQKKGRLTRTEMPTAMREAPQAMNDELICPGKEDDTETDQPVMVLEQQAEKESAASVVHGATDGEQIRPNEGVEQQAETESAASVVHGAMDGEQIRPNEEDDAETDQLGMVLEQHSDLDRLSDMSFNDDSL